MNRFNDTKVEITINNGVLTCLVNGKSAEELDGYGRMHLYRLFRKVETHLHNLNKKKK